MQACGSAFTWRALCWVVGWLKKQRRRVHMMRSLYRYTPQQFFSAHRSLHKGTYRPVTSCLSHHDRLTVSTQRSEWICSQHQSCPSLE